MHNAYLSIGSNHDPEHHLLDAVDRLRRSLTVCAVSQVYQSAAMGHSAAAYWNAAIALETDLAPAALKTFLSQIEDAVGRDRAWKKTVAIDLDLIWYADHSRYVYGGKEYTLPDVDAFSKNFVLVPLAEIAPDLPDPQTGMSLTMLVQQNPSSKQGLLLLDFVL